jgi:hypothetical protein
MGERGKDVLKVNFDYKLRLEFHRTKEPSDVGLLAYREFDEPLGIEPFRILWRPQRQEHPARYYRFAETVHLEQINWV